MTEFHYAQKGGNARPVKCELGDEEIPINGAIYLRFFGGEQLLCCDGCLYKMVCEALLKSGARQS